MTSEIPYKLEDREEVKEIYLEMKKKVMENYKTKKKKYEVGKVGNEESMG